MRSNCLMLAYNKFTVKNPIPLAAETDKGSGASAWGSSAMRHDEGRLAGMERREN
jgi:hypothetical protein